MGRNVKWSDEHIEILKRDYPKYGCTPEMVKIFGRKRKYINHKAHQLGIKYSGKKKGCYKKGSIPFNKGQKMSEELRAKVSRTWFIKGNLPHNTKKNYDISFRKDNTALGYWYIRLSKANWVMIHREIYKNVHNVDLSDDDIVYFLDGNPHNIHPDNLAVRTKLEHLLHNNPNTNDEFIDTRILIAKLKKTIKNAKK